MLALLHLLLFISLFILSYSIKQYYGFHETVEECKNGIVRKYSTEFLHTLQYEVMCSYNNATCENPLIIDAQLR